MGVAPPTMVFAATAIVPSITALLSNIPTTQANAADPLVAVISVVEQSTVRILGAGYDRQTDAIAPRRQFNTEFPGEAIHDVVAFIAALVLIADLLRRTITVEHTGHPWRSGKGNANLLRLAWKLSAMLSSNAVLRTVALDAAFEFMA